MFDRMVRDTASRVAAESLILYSLPSRSYCSAILAVLLLDNHSAVPCVTIIYYLFKLLFIMRPVAFHRFIFLSLMEFTSGFHLIPSLTLTGRPKHIKSR